MRPREISPLLAAATSGPKIYFGKVMHRRLRPVENRFVYGVFFLRLPLSTIARAGSTLFSINRWNVFSLRYADYGTGGDPLAWIRDLLAREGFGHLDGEVVLQTFPRVLGYVFNPVSFWLCHDKAGALRAVLAEVRNTFGESHAYLLARSDGGAIRAGDVLEARKDFHVSPFLKIEGGYRFRFVESVTRCLVRIDYADSDGDMLHTSISGESAPLSTRALLRAFFAYPLMTLGVILRIHLQALRLWLRRVPFITNPVPPAKAITRWAQ